MLVYLHDLAGDATGYLVRREGLDVLGLERGDTLGSFDTNRYLCFFGTFYLRIEEHVFLLRINMRETSLVEGVIVDMTIESLESETLYISVRHIEEIEHLELVGIEFDAEGDGHLHVGVLGEPTHSISLRIHDIVALVDHLKASEVTDYFLGVREDRFALGFVRNRPMTNVIHRLLKIVAHIAHRKEGLVYDNPRINGVSGFAHKFLLALFLHSLDGFGGEDGICLSAFFDLPA